MNHRSLDSRTALVFGAGAAEVGPGNGAAIAIRMAAQGALVFAADKDIEAARRTQRLAQEAGGHCEAIEADVCKEASIQHAVQVAQAASDTIDILVNNVGVVMLGGPEEVSVEDWDRSFELNTRSAFLALKHVLPLMGKAGRGAIVQVSSVAGVRAGSPAYCAYTASKAALNALGMSVAMQYAARGIRCNNILLGMMDTALVRQQLVAAHPQGLEHLLATRNAVCPTGAMGSPWDAAEVAVFLASDAARYINGADIFVDGGLHNQVSAPVPA
ncbi:MULTISPECIES: SDR family NAD(P)-dependent oxidoreductase [unclassified Simplicispira]|uniref:SDR family NAD(P)-dependent oxidoreductase n=1 Tax=unclassified Simplicispira TaxID=2630407 RepID=UPI000D5DA4AE|nr:MULTISPECIES: SDR family oxidoreductase [unclassified Simplicispira]PVY56500.1 NAD(P)-dependent dehydrogenase (short-subunit alcohol dehydrogenase family) [Simplicispira sp. 125]REG17445.1 NAD(P)-dependent dehydrogenase (short-subunit alcohol dehydrogenase family) [Simplicispira sp. 110]